MPCSPFGTFAFSEVMQYAVNVEVLTNSEGFNLCASCSTQVMDLDDLKQVLEAFKGAISEIVSCPNALALPSSFPFHNPAPERTLAASADNDASFDEVWWTRERLLLRDIVSGLTGVPSSNVQAETEVVSLGIDSISAIQLSARAKKAGLRISSGDIASSITFGDLGIHLTAQLGVRHVEHPVTNEEPSSDYRPHVDPAISIKARSILPVSAGMEWLIACWQRSNGRLFHHAFLFEFGRRMSSSDVRSAWRALVEYHTILQCTFIPSHAEGSVSNTPVLIMYDEQDPDWLEQSLETDTGDELFALKLLLLKSIVSPPPVSRIPTRLTFIHGTSQDYFIINLHHIAYGPSLTFQCSSRLTLRTDAWSLPLLMNDFQLILNNQAPQSKNSLVDFLSHFKPSDTRSNMQRLYWQNLFRKEVSWRFFPYLDQGLHNGFSIGEDDQTPLRLFICHNAIRSLRSKEYRARELGVPLYFLLLASWGIVQRRYSSSLREEVEASDTVFGLWHLGRLEDSESSPELDMPSLAVPTINILPVRIQYGKGSDENIVLGAGKRLQLQLKKRSFVIQQSRWIDVAKWIAEVPSSLIF